MNGFTKVPPHNVLQSPSYMGEDGTGEHVHTPVSHTEMKNEERHSGWGRLPSFPLSPDLCAVSMSSNEMAGGDIKVLPDTRKHERERH